jgi:hypothetical protein
MPHVRLIHGISHQPVVAEAPTDATELLSLRDAGVTPSIVYGLDSIGSLRCAGTIHISPTTHRSQSL